MLVDGGLDVGRQVGLAAIALGIAQFAGEVEFEAHLVAHTHLQRRHQQLFAFGGGVRRKNGQAQVFHAAAAVAALQGDAADVLVVDADVQAGLVRRHRRRIAIARLQRDALVAPDEQVRRQVDIQCDGIGLKAAYLQLLRVVDQLGELYGAVSADPVGGVVRLACRRFDLLQANPISAQLAAIQCQRRRRGHQIVVVTTANQQQLAVAVLRVVDQFDGRPFRRWMLSEERRTTVVGGEHQRRLRTLLRRRQGIEQHREGRASPGGQAAEIGRENACGPLLAKGRRAGEDDRQIELLGVALVEEGQREPGQVAGDVQRLLMQADPALTTQVQPQAAVRGVFADIAVVADEFDSHPVEIAQQARVQGQLLTNTLADLLLGNGQRAHQLIVQVHAQVRQHRDQRRRWRVVQVQGGGGGDPVMTQAELDLLRVAYAKQQLVAGTAQVAEAATGVPARRRAVGVEARLSEGGSAECPQQGGEQRPGIGLGDHDGVTRDLEAGVRGQ